MTGYTAIPSSGSASAGHPDARIVLAIRGRGFGAETESTPAVDSAAWILVSLLVFCAAWILLTALLVKIGLRKQGPPDGLKTEARKRSKTLGGSPAWQKPEDWWKH
jgi:hypothetical protein